MHSCIGSRQYNSALAAQKKQNKTKQNKKQNKKTKKQKQNKKQNKTKTPLTCIIITFSVMPGTKNNNTF